MMSFEHFILARSSRDSGAGFWIFVAIFVVGAFINWLKKQIEQASRASPRRVPPPIVQPPRPPATVVKPALRAPVARTQRRPIRAKPAPPPLAAPTAENTASPLLAPAAAAPVATRAPSPRLRPLLRPATLRQQIVLMEVLQPPLALREHQQ